MLDMKQIKIGSIIYSEDMKLSMIILSKPRVNKLSTSDLASERTYLVHSERTYLVHSMWVNKEDWGYISKMIVSPKFWVQLC